MNVTSIQPFEHLHFIVFLRIGTDYSHTGKIFLHTAGNIREQFLHRLVPFMNAPAEEDHHNHNQWGWR